MFSLLEILINGKSLQLQTIEVEKVSPKEKVSGIKTILFSSVFNINASLFFVNCGNFCERHAY